VTSLDFTPPHVSDPTMRATHIVVSRGKFARAFGTDGRNVRLAIWLAGWHIDVYDEFVEKPDRFGGR